MSKQYKITVNGKTYDVLVEEVDSVVSSAPVVSTPKVVEESKPQVVQNTAPVASAPTTNAVENKVVESFGNCTDVKAQIPGTVVAYKVAVGDSVSIVGSYYHPVILKLLMSIMPDQSEDR